MTNKITLRIDGWGFKMVLKPRTNENMGDYLKQVIDVAMLDKKNHDRG